MRRHEGLYVGVKSFGLMRRYIGMENEKDLKAEIVMLERQIAELKARMPAHSIPVAMLQQLEDLEEALDSKRRACER